jgi:hypothetical protein
LHFSKHFQNQARFRQVFPKKALAVLWDFNGLQATKPDNDVSPNFSPLPPTFRPIPAAIAPHSGAAGAPERGRAIALQSVASRCGPIPNAVDLEFSSFLINRKKNVRRPGLIEPFSIQRPLWRRREISAADACRTKPSETPLGRRTPDKCVRRLDA